MNTHHTFHHNGAELAYRTLGDGPPLLLLSGALASTGDAWAGSDISHRDHLHYLAQEFRVVAFDTRGAGSSKHLHGSTDFDTLTDDVIALIDHLQLDRPVVAGFSEGGGIATRIAIRYPERVRGVVNHAGIDYLITPEDNYASVREWFGGSAGATVADPDHTERNYAAHEYTADMFRRFQTDIDGAQGEDTWRTYLQQLFARHVIPFGYIMDDLRTVEVPVLVLSGDRDYFYPVELAAEAYRALPNGELCVLPGTGHQITRPGVEAIAHFAHRVAG